MPHDVTLERIMAAAPAVYRVARRTPLVPFRPLTPVRERARRATDPGSRLYLKLENLQPIGAFKVRGAANAVARLGTNAGASGVWTVSAGNAAQGVALAAREAGLSCSALVIETAPAAKIDAIERLGARIVTTTYDDAWHVVEARVADRLPGHFIHPFDDDDFICGNGTVGLELMAELPDIAAVVVSVGGGGLISGVATAVKALKPGVRVYAAEPETAAPLSASLAKGRASVAPSWRASFVDGCGGQSVTPSMWPLLRDLVDDTIVVSLDEIADAMRATAAGAHVISEGAAGCAVAAALTGRAGPGPIAAIVSGGNVDPTVFATILQGETPAAPGDATL